MNRLNLVVLSILSCLTPVVYSADMKLGMAELCAKAASLQTPVDEARVVVKEIVQRGVSVRDCYEDFIMASRDKIMKKKLHDMGFDTSEFDEIVTSHEKPGLVCGDTLSENECDFVKKLFSYIVLPQGKRIIADKTNLLPVAGVYWGENLYRDALAMRDSTDSVARLQYEKGGLERYLLADKDSYYLLLAEILLSQYVPEGAISGFLRHELHHVLEDDQIKSRLLEGQCQNRSSFQEVQSLLREYNQFKEERADVLSASQHLCAAEDLVQAIELDGELNLTADSSTHPLKKHRLDYAQRILALLQAEEEFKQAYGECAATQNAAQATQ